MKSKWLAGLALGVAALAMGGVASAALVERNLFANGDGLLTRDTETHLDWLDLTETMGLSVTDVRDSDWYALGFVHATLEQITTLFTHSAVGVTLNLSSWGDPATVGANFRGASSLLELLGQTNTAAPEGGETYPFGQGFAADGPAEHSFLYFLPYYQVEVGTSRGMLHTLGVPVADGDTGYYWRGHYLVRAAPVPVSEPGTLSLFGLGLAGLALIRRREGLRGVPQ